MKDFITNKKRQPLTSGHTPWGFLRNLQAQFSLARFVTGDRFAASQSAMFYTANVGNKAKKTTMTQQIKILMILTLGFLIFNSCSVYRTETCIGKIGNLNYENTYIKKNKYEGVIFSKDYIGLMNSSVNKFTPTQTDIDSAEIVLRKGIKLINVNRPNQFDNCPVIDRKLGKYKRQYFGYIDTNGDKIIFINCFWDKNGFSGFIDRIFYKEPDDTKWKTVEKYVLDGCSYYWSIKVNLTKKTLFDFGVNGIG